MSDANTIRQISSQPERTGARCNLKVLVIGAGTGGGALAHALKRAGVEVAVFERDRTRISGPMGFRVGISPAGCQALQACISPELYDVFVATCARSPHFFNMLTEQMCETLSFGPKDMSLGDDPINSEKTVNRSTLRQVLFTGLEDVLQFDKKYTHYTRNADGSVTAYFEDGTSATGDVLVAADGTNSQVRKQYLPHAQLADSGMLSMGGKMPITPEARALLTPKILEGMSMIFASRGLGMILHVVEFNWDRNGAKPNAPPHTADVIARWLGREFDHPDDYIGWGLWGARQNFPSDPLKYKGSDLISLTLKMTSSWHPNLRKLIGMTDPATVYPINVRTSVPLPAWPASNITLLGDAIHTMTPGRGAGANTAMRDAALLSSKLIAARDGVLPLQQAIAEYEDEMRHYGFDAVRKSLDQMDGRSPTHKPVIGDLMLGAMRVGMGLVNAVPPLKRRVAGVMLGERKAQASA